MGLYDSNRILALTDSLENTGDISATTASYYRGAAASNRGMLTVAEQHLKEATANPDPDAADLRVYLKARALLSRILAAESDYEGALNEALPTQAMMDSLGNKDFGDLTQLHIVIGECQQHLHMPTEAAASFAKAYTLLKTWMAADTTGKDMPRIILRLDNISTSYIHTSQYAKAKMWLDREDSALAIYVTRPSVIAKQSDFLRGTVQLDLATICQQLGQSEEAARHYDEHRKTVFSQRNVALINATDYLMLAGRYAEAADNYTHLDQVFLKRHLDLSLDNIGTYLIPKMRANILAGRKDSALAVSMKIAERYDSALTSQKQDVAAELATVYDTHGKEQQIAEQRMRLSRVHMLALVVTLIALTVFFIIFTIVRQKAAKRLAKVNAAKERLEGELSIAHDIQMSMVPSTFPQVEGLDMYASMTPAKEVGGDLYTYLLKGDLLYFCVGDVSGKGVPASLFMAQTTRLFHTLASQGMNPAEICNIMNNELSGEDNEQGMFVTLFICRLNLKIKLLEYCNAGHNPPVLGNDDGQLSFLDMEANAPIGLWAGLEYVGESIDFFKDRLLFLYTDGLNEAEDTEQSQFGDDRLLDILRQTQNESARQIIETMTQEITRHRNGAEPNDDLTMMCIKL
ncbi:MAG: serine/threonine-protein phosphatase [Prevotella sp.]|nr:serine/threonine-protein phosphatase [Prevotella sp.]